MKLSAASSWPLLVVLTAFGCSAFLDLDSVNDSEAPSAGRGGGAGTGGNGGNGGAAGGRAGAAGDAGAEGGTVGASGSAGQPDSAGEGGASGGAGVAGAAGAGGAVECAPGFGDCEAAPGCETRLNTKRHCGVCNARCAEAAVCRVRGTQAACEMPGTALHGQRFEQTCGAVLEAGAICQHFPPAATACPMPAGHPFERSVVFGGDPNVVYDVVLRFAGAVEPKVYTGGTSQGDHFYVGGAPSATPYNAYTLTVSAPANVYHLNFDEGGGELRTVFVVDHEKTIPIAGGATLRLTSSDSDCRFIRNCADIAAAECVAASAPGVAAPPGPPGGQVLQIDVVSVTAR